MSRAKNPYFVQEPPPPPPPPTPFDVPLPPTTEGDLSKQQARQIYRIRVEHAQIVASTLAQTYARILEALDKGEDD